MFTAFGEQISTSREEYPADVEVFKEVKLLTDKNGYLYGLISSDDRDSFDEMISKIPSNPMWTYLRARLSLAARVHFRVAIRKLVTFPIGDPLT